MATAGHEPLTRQEFHDTLQHYATKADLSEMEVKLIKWMVGSQIGLVIALAVVMRLLG